MTDGREFVCGDERDDERDDEQNPPVTARPSMWLSRIDPSQSARSQR